MYNNLFRYIISKINTYLKTIAKLLIKNSLYLPHYTWNIMRMVTENRLFSFCPSQWRPFIRRISLVKKCIRPYDINQWWFRFIKRIRIFFNRLRYVGQPFDQCISIRFVVYIHKTHFKLSVSNDDIWKSRFCYLRSIFIFQQFVDVFINELVVRTNSHCRKIYFVDWMVSLHERCYCWKVNPL